MKIAHICLASYYTEGMTYQDNILPEINSQDGHEVIIVSNAQKYDSGKIVDTKEETKVLNSQLKLYRIKYDKILTKFISEKIRKAKKLKRILEDFNPDVILFHGTCGYELLTVTEYKKANPNIKLYVDSHEDFNNSARTFLSKNILHKLFYKKIINKCIEEIDKVFYLSEETKYFLENFYKIENKKLEFYPLGGFIREGKDKINVRKKLRENLKISEEDIILIHSGKLDKLKRTREILEAFINVKNEKLHLLIIGNIPIEEKKELERLIKSDKRIKFLGWKSGDELLDYICASDVYVQPGSQSATCQNAVCCGLPIILYPHISYQVMFEKNIFWVETKDEIEKSIKKIADNPNILKDMSKESYKIAKELLDYKKLARRLYR